MPHEVQRGSLGVISFGLALGVSMAIGVFVLGIVATLFDWGVTAVGVLSSLYFGYGPTFVGAVAGAMWAFVDGFIFGLLIAWFYNRFLNLRGR